MRLLAVLVMIISIPVAHANQERYALVIGNAAYQNETPLVNTLNDARDMATRLTALGFKVSSVENADRRQLTQDVNQFLRQVQGTDAVALVYYSGHGLQVGGQNYLLPVDAHVIDELDVPTEGLPVNQLLAGLDERGDNAVNLIILDACRNNPFKEARGTKSIGDRGLARVMAPGGTLILYATKPGDTASDNPGGRNGLFTQHLLAAISEQGKQVEDAFKEAAQNVYLASNRTQDPWMEGRIRGHFYFIPASPWVPGAAPIPSGDVPMTPNEVQTQELYFWQSVDANPSVAGYKAYLETYPNGGFVALAMVRLAELDSQASPSNSPLGAQGGQTAEIESLAFYVRPTPADARVRIMNIAPTYHDGIKLEPGRYLVEISKPGYQSHLQWFDLSSGNQEYAYTLENTSIRRASETASPASKQRTQTREQTHQSNAQRSASQPAKPAPKQRTQTREQSNYSDAERKAIERFNNL